MTRLNPVVALVVVFGLAAGLVVSGQAGPAEAVAEVGVNRPSFERSPAPPSSAHKFGVAPTQLGACNYGARPDEVGGWSGTRYIGRSSSGVSAESLHRPIVATLAEPCFDSSHGAGIAGIRIPIWSYSLPVPTSPQSFGAHVLSTYDPVEIVPGVTTRQHMMCGAAEWSIPVKREAGLTGNWSWSIGAGSTGETERVPTRTNSFPPLASGGPCAYVTSILIVLCHFGDPSVPAAERVRVCDSFVWSAENWYRGVAYNRQPLDVELCRAGAPSADCAYIDPPEAFTWETVCGVGAPDYSSPPPQPNWVTDTFGAIAYVFTTYIPWHQEVTKELIGHYARCMFAPPGGWDYQSLIPATWESSAFVNTFSVIEDAGTAFTITESCGVLMESTGTPLGTLTINTCDWASWGASVKTFILWTSWLAFAFWGIGFVVRTFLAAIKAAPMPNPLVTAVAEEDAAYRIGS